MKKLLILCLMAIMSISANAQLIPHTIDFNRLYKDGTRLISTDEFYVGSTLAEVHPTDWQLFGKMKDGRIDYTLIIIFSTKNKFAIPKDGFVKFDFEDGSHLLLRNTLYGEDSEDKIGSSEIFNGRTIVTYHHKGIYNITEDQLKSLSGKRVGNITFETEEGLLDKKCAGDKFNIAKQLYDCYVLISDKMNTYK